MRLFLLRAVAPILADVQDFNLLALASDLASATQNPSFASVLATE